MIPPTITVRTMLPMIEIRIGAGIFSIGFMVFTVLCKIAVPLIQGTHDAPADAGAKPATAPAT